VFKDKEALFQQALRQYTQTFFRDSMPRNHPPLECIRLWLELLAQAMSRDPKQKGCFIVNTMLEREAHSATTIAMIDDRLDEIEAFFRGNLNQAVVDHVLPTDFEIDQNAKFLLGAVVGMLAISRMRRDFATLNSIALGAFAILPVRSNNS
jgi:TetR/AcrR family transcriptional regulator, transcriptional repressor for nem operon